MDSISVENSPLIASFPEFESPAIVLVTSANFAGEPTKQKKTAVLTFNISKVLLYLLLSSIFTPELSLDSNFANDKADKIMAISPKLLLLLKPSC